MDGLVAGWGATKVGGSASSIIQEVTVGIMSNEECKKTKYGEKRITSNMMCAGHPNGGKDSCQVISILCSCKLLEPITYSVLNTRLHF